MPKVPTVADVQDVLEQLWPMSLAEDWDAVGPVVGRRGAEVHKILFAVDPTFDVVQEVIDKDVDLLITHHPLLLRPVNGVFDSHFKGNLVQSLVEAGCALITVHTNGDSAIGGVSDVLADVLGIRGTTPLEPVGSEDSPEGIGRVGNLEESMTLGDFAARVYSVLPAVAGGVRVSGDRNALIHRVAVCGGAGDSLFDAVRAHDADVFVTADLRHHPASEAREANDGRPYLIDVSHFASEWVWLPTAAGALQRALDDHGFSADIEVSTINTDPWDFILTP